MLLIFMMNWCSELYVPTERSLSARWQMQAYKTQTLTLYGLAFNSIHIKLLAVHETFSVKPSWVCLCCWNQKALKTYLATTPQIFTIGPQRVFISWFPASKSTQALFPLKERHLYHTVTSGRLRAKRLHLSEFLSMGIFRVVGGIPTSLARLVCCSLESWWVTQKYSQPTKEKTLWPFMKMNPLAKNVENRICRNSPLNTVQTGLTVKEYYLPGKAR